MDDLRDERILKAISDLGLRMEAGFETVDRRFQSFDRRFQSLDQRMEDGFAMMHGRFTREIGPGNARWWSGAASRGPWRAAWWRRKTPHFGRGNCTGARTLDRKRRFAVRSNRGAVSVRRVRLSE